MELYRGIRPPKEKTDWRLGLAVGAAVLLILLISIPLVFSSRLFYRHHSFVQDLSSALVHSRTLTAVSGEDSWDVPSGRASSLFAVLVDAGVGRPEKQAPAGEELSLTFDGGACLSLRPLESADKPGIWISFTRPGGSAFSYSTEKLQYDRLFDMLRN